MAHVHRVPGALLTGPVRVLVVGCGGNGSAIACGLPYLHQTLIARGHPYGLHVALMDGDEVSLANTVRQPYSRSDVGLNKAHVLTSRLNIFWGLRWVAYSYHLEPRHEIARHFDVVVGCVDSHAARRVIDGCVRKGDGVHYWLDLGNNADVGQYVLGQPACPRNAKAIARLPTVAERYPEVMDAKLPERNEPSCSAAEAVTRQLPFLNQTLAQMSLSLLERLFAVGVTHHGAVVRLTPGEGSNRLVTALPIPQPAPAPAPAKGARARRRAKAGAA